MFLAEGTVRFVRRSGPGYDLLEAMKCPICQKDVALDDPNMPFCSDRCRMLDLGNWASEKYVISTPIVTEEEAPQAESEDDE